MFFNIKQDLLAFAKDGGFVVRLKIIFISHAFHLVLLYRFGCFISKMPVFGGLLRVLVEYVIRVLYASDISLKSSIGPGLVILHGHDIVIGGDVCIGKKCKILNGVTLGNKDTESQVNQQPKVGDNVVIGSGAKLLGAIEIGNNVVIGANSVVVKNLPSNVVVAGVPARVLKSMNV